MFSLTVVDHIRLDSEHVAQNYTVHARSAERLARAAFAFRIVIVSLMALAVGIAITNLIVPARPYAIASVAAASATLVAFAIYAVAGVEGRVLAHRLFAHRLWLVAEQFRSLVTEINDGIVDGAALMHRRDELIYELHGIYEYGFGVDQAGHEAVRLPPLAVDEAA